MRITFLIALCAALAALSTASPALAAVGDTLVGLPDPPPGSTGIVFPLQGDPASFPPAGVPVQRDAATISYPGITDQSNLLQVHGDCVYIDNHTNTVGLTPQSYFVPLRTMTEWTAFKDNLPAHLTLSGGCPPAPDFATPFGTASIATPARFGAVVSVSVQGQTAPVQAQCVAPAGTNRTCGAYAVVELREDGTDDAGGDAPR